MSTKENNLNRVAVGTGVGFIGALIGAVLQLSSGMILVRLVSTAEYGLYSLAAVFVATTATISTLGFTSGTPQLMGRYLSGKEYSRVWGIIFSTVSIITITSGILSFLIYLFAEKISILFGKPDLTDILRPFALVLWANAIVFALISVFTGIATTWPRVLFNELLNRFTRILGLVLVALMGWGIIGVVWVTVLSTLAICVAFCLYAWKRIPQMIPASKPIWNGRELLIFSLPLFGNTVISILLVSAATLLLGYLNTAEQVGHYSVSVTLARLLSMPLAALAFIYLPIATKLNAGNNSHDVEKLYLSSTKWIMLISLIVFLYFQLDAEFIIVLLFGEAYQSSANVLRILSIGYFLHVALGPNGVTLLAFGARKAVFYSSGIAAIINLFLGVVLMPQLGAIGASIAIAVALSVSNIFISLNLFVRSSIHPFNSTYLKPLFFSLIMAGILLFVMEYSPLTEIWQHILLFIFITVACVLSPIITRSIDESDLSTFETIEKKFFNKNTYANKIGRWCGIHS